MRNKGRIPNIPHADDERLGFTADGYRSLCKREPCGKSILDVPLVFLAKGLIGNLQSRALLDPTQTLQDMAGCQWLSFFAYILVRKVNCMGSKA